MKTTQFFQHDPVLIRQFSKKLRYANFKKMQCGPFLIPQIDFSSDPIQSWSVLISTRYACTINVHVWSWQS